jgi:hypothetical protein
MDNTIMKEKADACQITLNKIARKFEVILEKVNIPSKT